MAAGNTYDAEDTYATYGSKFYLGGEGPKAKGVVDPVQKKRGHKIL